MQLPESRLSPSLKMKKSTLKKFLVFSQAKFFLYFGKMVLLNPTSKKWKKSTTKKSPIFPKMELFSSKIKNFLHFRIGNFLDSTYISGWNFSTTKKKKNNFDKWNFLGPSLKNFLYFLIKRFFLYFRRELGNPEKQKFLIFPKNICDVSTAAK